MHAVAVAKAALLEGANVHVSFRAGRGLRRGPAVTAVDGVTVRLLAGETVGLVGESGSGKTTLGRVLVLLQPPDSGQVLLEGADYTSATGQRLMELRRNVQLVFQDPRSSLDPRMSVEQLIAEPLRRFGITSRQSTRAAVVALGEKVQLGERLLARRPAELSGGQRQRVGIARAIAVNPRVLICDEPVSSLDVSVQAQITGLIQELQRELAMTCLFITHDLSLAWSLVDRVLVMYSGRIVERGPVEDVFRLPGHPYTRMLLSAVPQRTAPSPGDVSNERRAVLLEGQAARDAGCSFRSRCDLYRELGEPDVCSAVAPPLTEMGADHDAACHFVGSGLGAISQREGTRRAGS